MKILTSWADLGGTASIRPLQGDPSFISHTSLPKITGHVSIVFPKEEVNDFFLENTKNKGYDDCDFL